MTSILMLMLPAAFAQETLPNDNAAESKAARNTLTFNPFHVLLGNLQFSYERINKSGKISLVPFASVPVFPLALDVDLQYFNLGCGVRYYPKGQGMIKYYTGFSVSGGYYEYGYNPLGFFSFLVFDNNYSAYGWFGNALIHNGVVVYPTKNKGFNMGMNLGIGAVLTQARWYDYVSSHDENVVLPVLEFSFTIGFKY